MGKPKMPKGMQYDPIEMIEKNAEVNRISEENPYGYARYETDENGNQKLVKGFSGKNEEIFDAAQDRALKGTIKNPLDAFKGAGGKGIMGLMGSMMSKAQSHYGTDGLQLNESGQSKGGTALTPPDTLNTAVGRQPVTASFPDTPMNDMSTAQQNRELQEREMLKKAMANQQGASGTMV